MRALACVIVAVVGVACAARGGPPRGPEAAPTAAAAEDAACPPEMAHVDGFCIDKWEDALVDENGQPHSPYVAVDGKGGVRAVSRAGVVPQGYVSADDARAACAEAGKRLCAEKEWLRACKGPRGSKYPYGDARRAGVCNGESIISPLSFMPPNQQFPDMTNLNNPKLNQLPSTVAKTGQYAGCTNGFGVFDMVGNLHEWIADPNGTFYGGYYQDVASLGHGEGCGYQTTAHEARYHDYSTGFRCCADAR